MQLFIKIKEFIRKEYKVVYYVWQKFFCQCQTFDTQQACDQNRTCWCNTLCAFMSFPSETNSNDGCKWACGILLFIHNYIISKHYIYKALYLYYDNADGHQLGTPWGARTNKITTRWFRGLGRPHDENNYISSSTVPMATNLDRKVTYLERLLSIMILDPLVIWSCKLTWQTKTIISLQCLWPPIPAEWSNTMKSSNPYFIIL